MHRRSRRFLVITSLAVALGFLFWWYLPSEPKRPEPPPTAEPPVAAPPKAPPPDPAPVTEYDLIIRGGTVYDGTGQPGRRADVAVNGERIAAVGDLKAARGKREIDASGLAVAPGFIDPHNHTWDTLPDYPTDPDAKSMLMQGVTTVIGGVDGRSSWPLPDLFREIEATGTGVNYGSFAGQGTIRALVMGSGNSRAPSAAELARMEEMVANAMKAGAFGLSTGLEYEGREAGTAELTALARVAAQHGGVYSSHVRSERNDLLSGIAEALTIGRDAGIAVNLSHLKLMNPGQWSQIDALLRMVEEARAGGLQVFADVYPYLAPDYLMNVRLSDVYRSYPPEALQIRHAQRADLVGKSLAQVAAERGRPGAAVAQELLQEDPRIRVAVETGREDLMIRLVQAGFTVVGSDGEAQPFYQDPNRIARLVHPRSYGSYPKLLQMVREQKIMPLERMIRKMSGAVADGLGLSDRGYIREGQYADLVIFSPAAVKGLASWASPQAYPEGITHVLVNGKAAVTDGRFQEGVRFGKIVRHGARP